MAVLPIGEVRYRLRPRPATVGGGLFGVLYGFAAVCPEQGLMFAILPALFAGLGLLGEAPDSWRGAWAEIRTGHFWDVRGWMMRAVGAPSAWAAVAIVATALPRWISDGGC